MALTITTNIHSLSARRQAILIDAASAKSLQRLSSGSRINGAADDAAGLAMTDRMTSRIGGMDQSKRNISLRTGWLTSAEQLVKQYYGITGSGSKLTVNLDWTDGAANVLASVGGSSSSVVLNLDMADFTPTNLPDGGSAFMFSDRVIAHEMVHAVMRSSTSNNAPLWFLEGAAELIHGADDRLQMAIANTSVAAVAASVTTGGAWTYEGAYAATRYLHHRLKELGVEGGVKGIMTYMSENRTHSFDQAINAVTGGAYADGNAFVSAFNANGATFINTKMNLANADTGAIGGLDADGGAERTARSVVPEGSQRNASDPLEGFAEIIPTTQSKTAMRQVQVQAGAGPGEVITLGMSAMNSSALGLGQLDLANAAVALLHIDEALDFVTGQRVVAGASLQRLEFAATTMSIEGQNLAASRSRIRDTDYAAETAAFTRTQILQQAASAMITQANSVPSAVLSLLR